MTRDSDGYQCGPDPGASSAAAATVPAQSRPRVQAASRRSAAAAGPGGDTPAARRDGPCWARGGPGGTTLEEAARAARAATAGPDRVSTQPSHNT